MSWTTCFRPDCPAAPPQLRGLPHMHEQDDGENVVHDRGIVVDLPPEEEP